MSSRSNLWPTCGATDIYLANPLINWSERWDSDPRPLVPQTRDDAKTRVNPVSIARFVLESFLIGSGQLVANLWRAAMATQWSEK